MSGEGRRRATPVLSVTEASKRYGDVEAVASLSFTVHGGEELAIVGPNGSGKSTILHMIVGLVGVGTGDVLISGRPPSDPRARRTIGFVPDDLPLPGALTGAEYLALHRSLRHDEKNSLEQELVEVLDLAPHLGRMVAEYSHGMKRKLQLAAAAAQMPALLILDEPHRGLDPEAGMVMRSLLSSVKARGVALLVATHDLHAAQEFGDTVLVLSRGHRVGYGSPAEICHQAGTSNFADAFLRLSGLHNQAAEATGRIERALDGLDLSRL